MVAGVSRWIPSDAERVSLGSVAVRCAGESCDADDSTVFDAAVAAFCEGLAISVMANPRSLDGAGCFSASCLRLEKEGLGLGARLLALLPKGVSRLSFLGG